MERAIDLWMAAVAKRVRRVSDGEALTVVYGYAIRCIRHTWPEATVSDEDIAKAYHLDDLDEAAESAE